MRVLASRESARHLMPRRASTRSSSRKPVSPDRRPRPRVRKKLWIFDFDNTIARLEPEVDWAASRRELEPMLREAGIPHDLFEKYPRGNILLYNDMRARLLVLAAGPRPPRSFSTARVREIIRRASKIIEKYELAGAERAAPMAGAIELMKLLKKSGARVAIVTSNSSRTIRRWLSIQRLSGVVDAIVGRDSYLALKPSPETIKRVLEICNLRPSDAAFAGDADSDYQAASALRMEFFGIASNEKSRENLSRAGAPRMFPSPAALALDLNLADTPGPNPKLKSPVEHARSRLP